MGLIPKMLHIIWVGDEARKPQDAIDNWQTKHPAWQFRLWGDAELNGMQWKSRHQIDIFRASERWEGVADLMRYEILHEHGGVYVDADTTAYAPSMIGYSNRRCSRSGRTRAARRA